MEVPIVQSITRYCLVTKDQAIIHNSLFISHLHFTEGSGELGNEVGICPAGGRPFPLPCGGPIHEHRMDAMWLKATMSFAAEGVRSSELDAPPLQQTPQPSVAASILFVIPLGFEPKTHSLEGCCSIQLSYGTRLL